MQTRTVDVKWNTGVEPAPPAHRRWPFVVGAIVVAAVVTVVATVLIVRWTHAGDGSTVVHPEWHPPAQTFLASSMRLQPVPGWRVRVGDLGLPDETRIATSDNPSSSEPFIGPVGDRGYFLANSPSVPDKQWWLVGVDARGGHRLFAPVRLDTGVDAPKCFLNGSDAVLCLREDVQNGVVLSATAQVIDTRTGTISFTGPTDVHPPPGDLGVEQVGIYAVAGTLGQGVYGVGPQAQTTWFVPGAGTIAHSYTSGADVAPQTVAAEVTGGGGSDQMVVFSVVDGKPISPDLTEGSHPLSAAVYPGGFAVEVVADQRKAVPDGIEFFDAEGKRIGKADISGLLSTSSADLPIVQSSADSTVFSPSGGKLAEISGLDAGSRTLLIGSHLFVEDRSGETVWRSYDLSTGTEGKSCKIYLGDYIGSDGTTALFEGGNPNVGLATKAVDLTKCDTLWTLSSPAGSFRDVWRINTTLVQLSDNGTELTSLVPPS
jgi:hypothetical protein